jgi:hypothetical protein
VGRSDRRGAQESSRWAQKRLPFRELVREALFDTAVISGLEYIAEVLEEERTAWCQRRYRHDLQRQALRAGSASSY